MIEKSDSKWVSLATVSILGQPPRPMKTFLGQAKNTCNDSIVSVCH
ncbi:MAG: hypothetical protein V3V31_15815 [Methylococcales bacterium]